MAGDGLPRAALVAQLRAWADDVRARWSGVGDVVAVAVDTIALATERRLRISLTELRPHTRGAPSGEVERLRARVAELERELPEHIGVRGCCELCWRRACSGKECNKCQKAREVLARALQPTAPDPTPSSGKGEA